MTARSKVLAAILGVLMVAVVMAPRAGATAQAATTRTLTAVADAFVTSARPWTNFGRSRELRLDRHPTMRAYLTFRIRLLNRRGTRALLHIYSKTSQRQGFSVRTVAHSWNERTIVYANAPRLSRVRARSGRVRVGHWTTIDVSPLVKGKDVLRIALTTRSSSTIRLTSRESAHPPRLGFYPASYLAGPAGARIVLPPRQPGAFLGVWPGGPGQTWQQAKRQFLSREQFVGRKLDIMGLHYGAPNDGCYYPPEAPFSVGREAWAARHGAIPYVSWSPGFSLDQINAGQADACFRDVARRAKAYGGQTFLRMYWEFNGTWLKWSFLNDAPKFIAAWRRTVNVFRAEGARSLSWVWCPAQSHYNELTYHSYPGDRYVDWVCSDGYNWNAPDAWCGALGSPHPGWCSFEEIFHAKLGARGSAEIAFRGRKPFMVGEVGTVEGALGQKGTWHRQARDQIKSSFPGLKAYVYFDQDPSSVEGCSCNWRLDSSQSSLNGFRAMARDAYFRTRG